MLFRSVLETVYSEKKQPFIIIIDEWNCIFRKYPDNVEEQKKYLDFLRFFIKGKSYVALAYMTGILPIKKYGEHSALNMYDEYSMTNQRELAEFTGFTEEEVKELCVRYDMPYEKMKQWYDGYELKDIRIDVCRASGAGGQCVNTTDSAVRLTHIPTGIVIYSQTEKSQIQNKAKAFALLRTKLFDLEQQKAHDAEAELRKSQIGTGDRSEKIRTYNFPQGRVTDHRINLTLYKLDKIMNGDIQEIIDACIAADQAAKLANMNQEA